jgi:hypothetical protein
MGKYILLIMYTLSTSLVFSQKTDTNIPGVFPKEACGVWCWYSYGGTPSKWNGKIEVNETYSKIQGIPILVDWNELEPKEGVVNLDLLDDVIKKAAAQTKYVFTLIWLNPTEPDWFMKDPLQNLYWSALYTLHSGLDIWNLPQKIQINIKTFRGKMEI